MKICLKSYKIFKKSKAGKKKSREKKRPNQPHSSQPGPAGSPAAEMSAQARGDVRMTSLTGGDAAAATRAPAANRRDPGCAATRTGCASTRGAGGAALRTIWSPDLPAATESVAAASAHGGGDSGATAASRHAGARRGGGRHGGARARVLRSDRREPERRERAAAATSGVAGERRGEGDSAGHFSKKSPWISLELRIGPWLR